MAELTEVQRDLQTLEAELKQLEAEYNMFFSGRAAASAVGDAQPRRGDHEALGPRAHRHGRRSLPLPDAAVALCQTFVDLWDRGQRAREEGRPGPFAQPPPKAVPKKPEAPESKVLHVTAFQDPMREMDKLHSLYDSLMDARRAGRRRRRAVPPVRGAGQGSGDEAARDRQSRGRVPRGGEGRESELYRAGIEGARDET